MRVLRLETLRVEWRKTEKFETLFDWLLSHLIWFWLCMYSLIEERVEAIHRLSYHFIDLKKLIFFFKNLKLSVQSGNRFLTP